MTVIQLIIYIVGGLFLMSGLVLLGTYLWYLQMMKSNDRPLPPPPGNWQRVELTERQYHDLERGKPVKVDGFDTPLHRDNRV